MLAEDRVRVRRGHIHHDSATGEIIRHAPGVSVPAGWTSLQSLRHLLNLPDRRGWGMTPTLFLRCLRRPPHSIPMCCANQRVDQSRSFKNGSSVDGNHEG